MFGPNPGKTGQCNAKLEIGDDWGDNHSTFRCQLTPAHDGKHREVFQMGRAGEVVIEWEHDDTEPEPTYEGLPDWVRPGKFITRIGTKDVGEIMGVYANDDDGSKSYEIHVVVNDTGLDEYKWPSAGEPPFWLLFTPTESRS